MGDIIDLHNRLQVVETVLDTIAKHPSIKELLEKEGLIKKENEELPPPKPKTKTPIRL